MNDRKCFEPCDEQKALIPEISGNAINGLGESKSRRPSPIYWHNSKKIFHGKQQQWMLERTNKLVPEINDLNHQLGGRGPYERASKASTKIEKPPEEWTHLLKEFAFANESDLVGVVRLNPQWVFEGYDVNLPWVVVLGMAMDHAQLATAPEPPSVIEVMAQYNRGTRAARTLADWILQKGYEALPHGGPQAGMVTMIPAALACGFGELGKHGSIINRTYGASFRLACVLTDLPLMEDSEDTFGVDEFCAQCRLCTKECPPDAIVDIKQLVRGENKWYIDFDKCVPYFNETFGCGICIAVCPWSRPGVAGPLAKKMARRLEKRKKTEELSRS